MKWSEAPNGEYICAKRACTLEENYANEIVEMKNRLINRGYKRWILEDAEKEVGSRDRRDLLQNNISRKPK